MLDQSRGRAQSKTVGLRATLNCICWGIAGSQWRTSWWTGVKWSNLPAPTTRRAAALSTICRRRIHRVRRCNSQPGSIATKAASRFQSTSSVGCQGPPKLLELVEAATDRVPGVLIYRQLTVNITLRSRTLFNSVMNWFLPTVLFSCQLNNTVC